MLRPGRVALPCLLVLLAAALALPAGAGAQTGPEPRVVLALWQASPGDNLYFAGADSYEPRDRFLRALERRPGFSFGLISTVQGDYAQEQALLDFTQGTRQSTLIYEPRDVLPVTLEATGASGRMEGWEADVRRAKTASSTIRPGLLASSIPGGAGFAGVTGRNADGAIAATDQAGNVAAVSLGPPDDLARRARSLLATRRFVVVSLPDDRFGQAALDQLVAQRARGEMLLVAHLGFPPPERSFAKPPSRFFKQPAFALADDGPARGITSATTRQPGLVSAIDVLPTVLEHLRIDVPNKARGEPIEKGERLSAQRLEELRRRWADVRGARQSSSLRGVAALATVILLAIGALRGVAVAVPPALRIGALAMMWWPTTVLLTATLEPQRRLLETTIIALSALVLGLVTDRLLPWPRGPILPAAVGLAAYTVDLAAGADLLTRSVLGPSVAFGARFYGISNELEPLLPILLLTGLAAFVGTRARSRRLALTYGISGLVLGLILGWGRLGADVGGVLTVAGAFAVATLMMLPGGITKRSVVLALAAPVAALALLIVVDLVLSGGSHLSRNLLRAENSSELWELVTRRYELAFQTLVRGRTPAYFLAAALAVGFAYRNRELLYAPLRGRPAWAATLVGGLAAGVVGMLTNDSGPVLLINAVIALGAVTAYVRGAPGSLSGEVSGPPAPPAPQEAAGRPAADPVLTA